MRKPKGKYKCVACGRVWNGGELYDDPMSTATRWTCGDLTCGANVVRVNPPISRPEGGKTPN